MIIGYIDTHKAYILVDVEIEKVSFSWDVVVDENVGLFQMKLDLKIFVNEKVLTGNLGRMLV